MKFSVIIPTYNRADLLDRCLESLSSQTYKDFEVLVCDDGSTDNSSEVTQKYVDQLDIQYIWNENWGGPARPRNVGIEMSKGEWICFLDSDDWWTPTKLEACLPYLEKYDILYHDMQVSPRPKSIFRKRVIKGRDLPERNTYATLLLGPNPVINSSVVIRRSCVEQLGPISQERELIAVEDYDYWLRAAKANMRFKYINQTLGYYWIANGNISFNVKQLDRINALYDKHLYDADSELVREVNNRVSVVRGRILHLAGHHTQAMPYYRQSWQTTHSIKALIFMLMIKIVNK